MGGIQCAEGLHWQFPSFTQNKILYSKNLCESAAEQVKTNTEDYSQLVFGPPDSAELSTTRPRILDIHNTGHVTTENVKFSVSCPSTLKTLGNDVAVLYSRGY